MASPSAHQTPVRSVRIMSNNFQLSPMEYWLSWDVPTQTPTTVMVTPQPPQKRARHSGGQQTLTQIFTESEDASSDSGTSDTGGVPRLIDNETLIVLLERLQESLQVLTEQIKTAYYWFNDTSFPQKDWIEEELPEAIKAIKICPAFVSVMGMTDMGRFLPSIRSTNTYVLLKHLSVNHGFGILLDLDQTCVTVTYKLVHELKYRHDKDPARRTFGSVSYTHGTDDLVSAHIFDDSS